MNSNPTQCQRILDYMIDHGSITQLQAQKKLGVMRLGARIFELRKNGHQISSEMVKVKNRYGEMCRVKRYRLSSDYTMVDLKGDSNGNHQK